MAIYKAVKYNMIQGEASIAEKFAMLKELGFDGVELDSPGGVDKSEALEASRSTGLPIHGVVNSLHWTKRMSDPDPAVRALCLEGLQTSIRESHQVGGTAVLIVPGKVSDDENENHDQVWQRSIKGIRQALPLAAKLGIHVLIENVWNGFCYDPDQLAAYVDEYNSPWVGVYFDIGNHQKYGRPANWIRTLGKRIVKVDVKDWGKVVDFCEIGEGDLDWTDVRRALDEIGYHGWATAEVAGGDRQRLVTVAQQMNQVLGL